MLHKMAVTGGIASGKSTATRMFKELGASVASADEIVHQLLTPNTTIGQKVIQLLGRSILTDNAIDRSKVAKIVFAQPPLLRSLESIIHPAVLDEIDKQYDKIKQSNNVTLFVAEIPLLFEMGAEKRFDATLCVISKYETCINRFTQNAKFTKNEFDQRMSYQLSPEEKAKRATYVIDNNASVKDLFEQIKLIYHSLT